jgi:hypothetical protein
VLSVLVVTVGVDATDYALVPLLDEATDLGILRDVSCEETPGFPRAVEVREGSDSPNCSTH